MRTLYLYNATSGQYLGQRTLGKDDIPFLDPGQGCTATAAPTGQTLSEHFVWDGDAWRPPVHP